MALTIVESRTVTGGVDTHFDVHVAAALDGIGGLLGVEEFPTTPAGYTRLLRWLRGFGSVDLVGIEGTGSYGAGLARYVQAAGVRAVEVDRSDRQDRRRQGKSDPLDSRLPEARLQSLYDAPEFGGEKTMRTRVIRELIDEIRTLRQDLAGASDPTEFPERT